MTPKRKWAIIIFTTLFSTGIMAVFLLFPRLGNHRELIYMDYVQNGAAPLVIQLYRETTSSENISTHLTGYEIRTVDPASGKVIHKLFMKISSDHVPPPAELLTTPGKVWLVNKKEFIQGDTGWVKLFTLSADGQLATAPINGLNGMSINGRYLELGVQLVNRYNEEYCLDLNTGLVSAGNCYREQTEKQPSFIPFFVRNTPTSTRFHMYSYASDSAFPPPAIFAGMLSGDELPQGMSIKDDLDMNRGQVSEGRLVSYRKHLQPWERITAIGSGEYLYSPRVVYQDSLYLFVAASDSADTRFRLYGFSSDGKINWVTEADKAAKENIYTIDCVAKFPEAVVFTDRQHWITGLDRQTGKTLWMLKP